MGTCGLGGGKEWKVGRCGNKCLNIWYGWESGWEARKFEEQVGLDGEIGRKCGKVSGKCVNKWVNV